MAWKHGLMLPITKAEIGKSAVLSEISVNEKGWCEKGYLVGYIGKERGYRLGAAPRNHGLHENL